MLRWKRVAARKCCSGGDDVGITSGEVDFFFLSTTNSHVPLLFSKGNYARRHGEIMSAEPFGRRLLSEVHEETLDEVSEEV